MNSTLHSKHKHINSGHSVSTQGPKQSITVMSCMFSTMIKKKGRETAEEEYVHVL